MTPRCHLPITLAAAIVLSPTVLIAAKPEQPPASEVQILQPSAGAELAGAAEVRVKITPPERGKGPLTVFCGIGGAPWTKMESAGQAGEWSAEIDTTIVPNGSHEILIMTDEKRARGTGQVTLSNPLKVFFADLHSHTGYSDGTLTPAIAHEYARDVAKLDVFCLTDHLEQVDDTEWLDTREVAWDFNEDGKFVVIPGLEWTKKWGHINLYDPKTRVWPEDPKAFYRAIADAGIVAKFNHPGTGEESHSGLEYSEVGDRAIQMIEVRRPEEEQAFIRALRLGWHIAPDGSTDTHSSNWGNTSRWTGILAAGLSKRCIWDALKKRHVYSTLDRNCRLFFTVNGATMGDILDEPTQEVEIAVVVEDADAGDTVAKIELFEDGEVVQTAEPNDSTCRWKTACSPELGGHYYFAKVTQADGNMLWSAPVWVVVDGE